MPRAAASEEAAESAFLLKLEKGDDPPLPAALHDVYLYIMKRTQIYVDIEQDEALERRANAAGVTKSALIREAIDIFLKGSPDERLRLGRFRAAVRGSAGSAGYLPDGKSYVEALRALDTRRQEDIERRRRA